MSIPVYKNERKNPMSSMTSGPEPRYKYGKPTEKPQFGKPPELGTDINKYTLPVIDVDTDKRNFPGYGVSQYFTLDEMRDGDYSGTTETDATDEQEATEMKRRRGYLEPDAQGRTGYTRINNKSKLQRSRWNTARS